MITHVIVNKEQGKTFATFFIRECDAKKNLLNLTKVRDKSLLSINDFFLLKGEVFNIGNKKTANIKSVLKHEIDFVTKNYPLNLKYYSNIIEYLK